MNFLWEGAKALPYGGTVKKINVKKLPYMDFKSLVQQLFFIL